MEPCVGILLAGGGATRFGGAPKGLARIEGSRIADRVLVALTMATSRQVIVANDPRAAHWFPAHEIVRDRVPGLGPLAGLVTALEAAGGAPALVVAWDMPYVTGPLLRALRDHAAQARVSCAPVHGIPPTVEPLCALYQPDALATATALLDAGERRAHALFDALLAAARSVPLPANELARHGAPSRLFQSVDTAGDLAALGGTPPDRAPPR